MDLKVWMYLMYLLISVGLTVWVARTLSRNGMIFLADVFANDGLAKAVNSLLVVGFYLLNLGYVTVAMRHAESIGTLSNALEELSLKIGFVLLVLGGLHFFNVFALGRYRRGRLRQTATHPPLPPAARLPMHPPTAVPGAYRAPAPAPQGWDPAPQGWDPAHQEPHPQQPQPPLRPPAQS